jgi:hypothetical protein
MSLARGWSPTRRQAIAARFVVGTLLLVTPLWVGYVPLDLDGTEYRYRTTDVTVEDGELAFGDESVLRLHGVERVDCSSDNPFEWGRVCGLERELVAEGPRTVPGIVERVPDPEYVEVGGEYYERNTTLTENGTRLALERVSARTVLEDVSVSPSTLPLAGKWAVWTGSVAADERPAFEGRIVETDDGYTLVYLRGYSLSSSAGIEPVVWVVGIGAGVALLRSGYRAMEE